MPPYRIVRTVRARRDLEEIGRHTLERWGRRQMVKYLRELDSTIQKLVTEPTTLGQDRSQIRPGLRSIRHKHCHYVFYRVEDETVELIRILHQRRDWASLLAP